MSRVFNKFLITAFLLLSITSTTIGAESEYKNSLVKVELSKKGDSAYNINLYTQKKFQEPVKVIKKSDLNYYILLPETKNSVSQTAASSADIRNVSINLYPYAGQEANSGYTKINIDTTKPINFDLNIKQLSQNSSIQKQETIAQQPGEKTNSKPIEKKDVQKKNSSFQGSEKSIKTTSLPKVPLPKTAFENDSKIIKEKIKKNNLNSEKKEKAQKNTSQKINIPNPPKEKPIEPEEEKLPSIDEINSSDEESNDDAESLNDDSQESAEIQTDNFEDEQIENSENTDSDFENPYSFLQEFKTKIKNKLALFNINLKDFIFMAAASFFTFLFIFIILSRKQQTNFKLKNKMELLSDEPIAQKSEISRKKQKSGEYFIFDKNIRQTRLNTSSNTKRNYELSCYDPDLRINYKKNTAKYAKKDDTDNEYDIIQKILKEESLLEFEPKQIQKPKTALKPVVNKKPLSKQNSNSAKTVQKNTIQQQPKVLSSVEIAPERGFMCVSYNNNINLLGYIFDDVFPLYNFRRQKLDSYDIKFRLTDKDDKGANFIVRIDNVKMVVRATKHQMNMEVLI